MKLIDNAYEMAYYVSFCQLAFVLNLFRLLAFQLAPVLLKVSRTESRAC